MGILNCCLIAAIQFHDTLHGFCTVRGTGTASLKANMSQHLMAKREDFLYDTFLDLYKAYDALNRNRCLDILAVYGVEHWSIFPLRRYWDRLTMVSLARR